MASKILDRLIQIKTYKETSNKIVFIDDINKRIIKRIVSQSLDGETIHFAESKKFPYSHHIQ